MMNFKPESDLNPTSGTFHCQTPFYDTEIKMCPSFGLDFALKKIKQGTFHMIQIFYLKL